ncbi:MAG: transposase [Planctomycetota bacterium]|nr:transposase [Planctomycetota bacterium]
MSRLARVVVPGLPHHVTQRGNRRQVVFVDDTDRFAYRQTVLHYFTQHKLKVWAYCLMTNHVHFVVVPSDAKSLGLAFRDAHTHYALGFNKRHGLHGHLWQGRFYSCPLDGDHLWAAVRYVERNPVRAGMAAHAADYPWSSAAAHGDRAADALLSGDFPPSGVIMNWRAWLQSQPGEDERRVRNCTKTGRPCGSAAFVDELEQTLSRPLHPLRPGPKVHLEDPGTGSLWK